MHWKWLAMTFALTGSSSALVLGQTRMLPQPQVPYGHCNLAILMSWIKNQLQKSSNRTLSNNVIWDLQNLLPCICRGKLLVYISFFWLSISYLSVKSSISYNMRSRGFWLFKTDKPKKGNFTFVLGTWAENLSLLSDHCKCYNSSISSHT